MLIRSRRADVLGTILAFVGLGVVFVAIVFLDHGFLRQVFIACAIVLSIAALVVLAVPRFGGRD